MPKKHIFYSFSEAKAVVAALGLKQRREYTKAQKADERLPSGPDQTYRTEWIDWYDYLGTAAPEYYATYARAKKAAQKLGIRSGSDYEKNCQQDSLLPPYPGATYANKGWLGWHDFLGTVKRDYYPTYEQAQAAAQALNIKSGTEYNKRYSEDPRLPSDPRQSYAGAGWIGVKEFLGKKSLYATITEATGAVKSLEIKTRAEYRKAHLKDPKLPVYPQHVYSDDGWKGWEAFLGHKQKIPRYATYAEAQMAAQKLGIKSQPEYQRRYKEDPRLPGCPWLLYKDKGWSTMYDLLGTRDPSAVESTFPIIWNDLERWLKKCRGLPVKRAAIRIFLNEFYQAQGLPDEPRFLLSKENAFDASAYQRFIESLMDSMQQKYHKVVESFYTWLLDEYCTDIDDHERVVLNGFRNPFTTALHGYADSLATYRPGQSTKVPLGYEYILRSRQYLVPNGEQVMLSRPSLRDLPHLQQQYNSRADWMDVDQSLIDEDDPNCIWRIKHGSNPAKYQIWSPVRFIAMYTLLRYPLRGQQILWQDSGEADEEIPVIDAQTGGFKWVRNTGPHIDRGGKKRRPQGAIQKGFNGQPKMYVTTNKTGRGAEGGYEVEWVPDDIVYWFIQLRGWQAKYNPISNPTTWSSIGIDRNEQILKARGTQCFLFRGFVSGKPMPTITAFFYPLPALLFQIQREGENLAFQDPDGRSSNHYSSVYTPHSLRVSLITAYIIDGGAPLAVISKLVGHSNLVMTIYYTKLSKGQMRKIMDEAEKRAGQLALELRADEIRINGLAPMRGQLIATDGNRHLLEADIPNSACVVFDHGICAMSCSGCDEGGSVVTEEKNPAQNRYAPVEAGYLGKKNCPRCRFFLTGVPFLGGLVALANEVALETHTESQRYQDFTAEVERLEQEYFDACQNGQADTQQTKRKSAVALQQQSAGKLDGLLTDYVAINRYVQDCIKLINEGEPDDEKGVRLVTASDPQQLTVAYEESETQYHLLAEICQNATIYRSSNPSRAVPLIAEAIDRMAENNGLAPSMFRLNQEQKLVVANELNRLLLQRLGSWEKIDELFSGDLMLLDLDAHEPELTRISTEIRQILSPVKGVRRISHEVMEHE